MKQARCLLIFIVTLTLSFLVVTGCSNSDTSLLNSSLNNMNKKVTSYQFKGTATIDMGEIQGTGTVDCEGTYLAPEKIYVKMDTGIMDPSQQLELFINEQDKIFNRISGSEWVPYLAPPNLSDFQQPGQNQNPVSLLKNLPSVIEDVKSPGEEEVDGKKLIVITGKANTSKLKSLITKQLTKKTRSSEDEIELVKTLVKDMSINQDYTIYVEPNSELIQRLKLNQETTLKINEQETIIISEMVFDYYGFNERVEMPEV